MMDNQREGSEGAVLVASPDSAAAGAETAPKKAVRKPRATKAAAAPAAEGASAAEASGEAAPAKPARKPRAKKADAEGADSAAAGAAAPAPKKLTAKAAKAAAEAAAKATASAAPASPAASEAPAAQQRELRFNEAPANDVKPAEARTGEARPNEDRPADASGGAARPAEVRGDGQASVGPGSDAPPAAAPQTGGETRNGQFREFRNNENRNGENRNGEARQGEPRSFEPRTFEPRGDNKGESRPGEPRNFENPGGPQGNQGNQQGNPQANQPGNPQNHQQGGGQGNQQGNQGGGQGNQFGNQQGNQQGRGGLRFRGREGRTEFNNGGGGGFRNNRDDRGDQGLPREPGQPREGRNRFRDRDQRNGMGGGDREFERNFGKGRIEHDFHSLEAKTPEELLQIATEFSVEFTLDMPRSQVIIRVLEAQAIAAGNLLKRGILEILPDQKGFMRCDGYLPGSEDVYVSPSQIKKFNLKTGDMVTGQVRAPKEMERYYGLLRVEACNGEAPDINRQRKEFEKLTPIFPDDKFDLETTQENITARIIDLVSPIGMGQRGLIVAPPKAGKTSLIKNVANSIMANHPGVYLIVLLIDERPEEVTDISRSIKGEVVASTFDELPENHIRVSDMVLEKAKRMVEQGKDVVILLDSITRLSRASNLVVTPSGRTMSGGLDPAAMHKPKRLFGAARNIEEGGSLTILATVLVDTGSRMDEYIFEELKGTGNMDLVLDRNLFDQRIFPAIDINRSGTRRDDLLLSKDDLAAVFHLRKTLAQLDNDKAITLLIDRLKNTKTNADFMQVVQKSARSQGNGAPQGPPPAP